MKNSTIKIHTRGRVSEKEASCDILFEKNKYETDLQVSRMKPADHLEELLFHENYYAALSFNIFSHLLYIINDSLRRYDLARMEKYVEKYLDSLYFSYIDSYDIYQIEKIEFEIKLDSYHLKGYFNIEDSEFEMDYMSLFYMESLASKKIYFSFPLNILQFVPHTHSYTIKKQGVTDHDISYILNRRQEIENIFNIGLAFFRSHAGFYSITQILDIVNNDDSFWNHDYIRFVPQLNYAMAYIAMMNIASIKYDKLPSKLLKSIVEYTNNDDFINTRKYDIIDIYAQYNHDKKRLQFFSILDDIDFPFVATITKLTSLEMKDSHLDDLDHKTNLFSNYSNMMRFLHDIYHAIDFSIENQKEDKDD